MVEIPLCKECPNLNSIFTLLWKRINSVNNIYVKEGVSSECDLIYISFIRHLLA